MEYAVECRCNKITGAYELWIDYRSGGKETLNNFDKDKNDNELYTKYWGYPAP